MKRFVTLVAMLSASLLLSLAQPNELARRLRSHVEYLTSEPLSGRKAGTEGALAAADYIRSRFDLLGLKTFERADYYHTFTVSLRDGVFRNVVGRIEGTRKNEYIVIGAHYDHLGIERGELHPGADDNASGTAALLEVARLIAESGTKPTYTLLFAAFDAEEMGLHGSKDLAARLPKGSVRAMINMDMVGWLKDGELKVEGTGTLSEVEQIVARVAKECAIEASAKRFERGLLTATDTEPFAERGFPTLALTTGLRSPYHKPEDTADKIDYEGLAKVTLFATRLTEAIDTTPEVVATGRVAQKHKAGSSGLEWGIIYSFGNNYHHYPDSAIRGREADAWALGLRGQYNIGKHLGVRLGATYESRKALTPVDVNDPYGKGQTIGTKGVTIPAEVMVKTAGSTNIYANVGGYWSYAWGAKVGKERCTPEALGLNREEWGLSWGFGTRLGGFFFEATFRYSLTPAYTATTPRILNRTTLCTLGVMF